MLLAGASTSKIEVVEQALSAARSEQLQDAASWCYCLPALVCHH
jgi:hypothetical protein